jgi:dihydrofolate reductase
MGHKHDGPGSPVREREPMNRALMAAGMVDRVQVTIFPVITGQTGVEPIFQGAADFDLELIESRTLDGHIQELIYRPTLHV